MNIEMSWHKPFLVFFAFALFSCNTAPDRDDKTIFRYNESAGISSLDPAFSRNQANIWGVNQLFNGLVQFDDNLNILPSIAKDWSIDSLGKRFTFNLRDDVLFHEDSAFQSSEERLVKAEDVVFSFERLRSKELVSPGAWVLSSVDSIISLNDSTLIITLNESFPAFINLLAMQYCGIVSKKVVEHYDSDFIKHPIGTGPFYFKLWVANEKLVFRKNPDYFEKDEDGFSLPYLEAVSITFVPDKQTAFLSFLKGDVDILSGIDPSYKDELLTSVGELNPKYNSQFNLFKQDYLNTEYLAFMVDTANVAFADQAWRDKKVRQAINYGFNRAAMMKYLRNNIGRPANNGFVPSAFQAFKNTDYGYSYQPEKAKSLLIEAGYAGGKGLGAIKLSTNASYVDLCEFIQSELTKVGIKLEVEVVPPSTLRQSMATSKVGFFRASWIADYPDPENYLSLFYSANKSPEGPNYTHFENANYDGLYMQSKMETNVDLRNQLYLKMDSIIMDEGVIVPLYYDQVLRFYPKSISGLEGNALNLLNLKTVRKN